MNKRFFIALVLTAIVIVLTPQLFPTVVGRTNKSVAVDSTVSVAGSLRESSHAASQMQSDSGSGIVFTKGVARIELPVSASAVDTETIESSRSKYLFTSRGGVPVSVVLKDYLSRKPGFEAQNVELVESHSLLMHYRIAIGQDTIALDTMELKGTVGTNANTLTVVYNGEIKGHSLRVSYTVQTDTAESYLVHILVSVSSLPSGGVLLIDLPRTLPPNGPDTSDDLNHLAVSYRSLRSEVNSIAFGKLDSVEVVTEPGPISWVAVRNKYFLAAIRTGKTSFTSMRLQGAPRKGKIAVHAMMSATLPFNAEGSASFDLYAGPQDFQRLQRLGGELDQVNPYAGWLHPVVQPFATMVMKALLWMKHTTHLNYGWVLVLFGIIIRLVLWPLNQSAMRTSMKMQRLQPELQALQKRHSDDPKKQQEAIMKVYKDHGMSPLSPLMGCLPMLLPMPVLFALYYVFQNTIEFRGVPFLWLPDISLHDPFYITPLLMGVSMFVMSWIGMRNAPPNPQAKMMSYMMPVMFTVLFLNFASGLNMYYAVQNIAALPQQWLLARERGKPGTVVSLNGGEKKRM